MKTENESGLVRPPSRRGLLLRLAAAASVAGVIVACFVLPAEYHIDPTGLGQRTGLMALSSPASTAQAASTTSPLAHTYPATFRSDVIDIPLRADEELEYKVKMQPGGTLVYSWSVNKGTVYYDFHGEPPDDPKKSQSYGVGTAAQANGSLIAPFAGIHGWFLQNQEGEPVVVRLKVSGFYELQDVPLKQK